MESSIKNTVNGNSIPMGVTPQVSCQSDAVAMGTINISEPVNQVIATVYHALQPDPNSEIWNEVGGALDASCVTMNIQAADALGNWNVDWTFAPALINALDSEIYSINISINPGTLGAAAQTIIVAIQDAASLGPNTNFYTPSLVYSVNGMYGDVSFTYDASGAAAAVESALVNEISRAQTAEASVQNIISGHAALTIAAHGGIVATDDPRLNDARTPTPHKSTHAQGGSDALSCTDIGADSSGSAAAAQAAANTYTNQQIAALSININGGSAATAYLSSQSIYGGNA